MVVHHHINEPISLLCTSCSTTTWYLSRNYTGYLDVAVDIIVSIIVPEKNYSNHLELLAHLSSKLYDPSVRKELRQARNSSQIIKNFHSDDLEFI